MVVTHEAGHAGAAKLLGGIDSTIYIWPGYEIYPDIGKKHPSPIHIKGLGFTELVPSTDVRVWMQVNRYENYMLFMGSGFTQLLSILSLCGMALARPQSTLRWLLLPGALLHIDMLTYTVFPLFNLPHLVFWGGINSEPLIALARFGIPQYWAVSAVILLSALQFLWLYRLLRPRANQQPKAACVRGRVYFTKKSLVEAV